MNSFEEGGKTKSLASQGPAVSGGAEVTCPSCQAAAVACDRVTAISMAAVTMLSAVQPKRAVLWGRRRKESYLGS